MQTDKMELIMLGTGNAAVTKCYNTCFAIKNKNQYLLVDAGGGNGILSQLEKADISCADIHEIFITHAHTDHLLGAVWMIRMIAQLAQKDKYAGDLKIYAHDKVIEVLTMIYKMTLPKKIVRTIEERVVFCELKDGDLFCAAGMQGEAFDIGSTKEKQFGFRLTLPDNRSLVCLGDEPYNPANESFVRGTDWLLCEAFCLYADREIFSPYEKHHSTALDAGRLAGVLGVRNLVLYHTEDKTLASRKEKYTAEAILEFDGAVYVPDDLERISLD